MIGRNIFGKKVNYHWIVRSLHNVHVELTFRNVTSVTEIFFARIKKIVSMSTRSTNTSQLS